MEYCESVTSTSTEESWESALESLSLEDGEPLPAPKGVFAEEEEETVISHEESEEDQKTPTRATMGNEYTPTQTTPWRSIFGEWSSGHQKESPTASLAKLWRGRSEKVSAYKSDESPFDKCPVASPPSYTSPTPHSPHSTTFLPRPLPQHPRPFCRESSSSEVGIGASELEGYLHRLREEEEATGTDWKEAVEIEDWRDTRISLAQTYFPPPGSTGWLSLDLVSPIETPLGSSTPLVQSESSSLLDEDIPVQENTFPVVSPDCPGSPPKWWPQSNNNTRTDHQLEPQSPTNSVLLHRAVNTRRRPTMGTYTSQQPLVTFSSLKGELISEVFEAIETEEELRIDALDPAMSEAKRESAEARGPTLKKLRLRQSLGGVALEYFLALTPDIRSDYEKAKKALTRRFGDQSNTSTKERAGEARWAAITRMSQLSQNGRSYKEYILELEALSDALVDADDKDQTYAARFSDLWIKGFDDERDGRTMRLSASQETATTPEQLARVARKYFLTDKDRAWTHMTNVEVPVYHASASYAPASSAFPVVQGQPDMMEMLRQLSSQVQSLQLTAQMHPANKQNPTYRAPHHQRAPSDSQIQYAPMNTDEQMMCFNCRGYGHKAQHCPQYNPRRDGPSPSSQQYQKAAPSQPFQGAGVPYSFPKRDQSAPPVSRVISQANAVELGQPRIVPVEEPEFPAIHVERTFQVPQSQALSNCVVDFAGLVDSPVSSVSIAEALMADAQKRSMAQDASQNKRARVEPFDPVRDAFQTMLKDPEFEKLFVEAVSARARLATEKARLAKKKPRRSRHEVPPIRALVDKDEDSPWALALRLLRHIKFGIAHPGVSDAIFSLADVLNGSPRVRSHWADLMKSSEPKKRGRHAVVVDDDDMDTSAVFASFFQNLVAQASQLLAQDAGVVDMWLGEEESVAHHRLFYTYGLIQVGPQWKALGAFLIDGGALMCLISMTVVTGLSARHLLLPVTGVSYKTAAGSVHHINWKWRTVLKIANCQARVTLFVTETDAPYGILLSRRFMAQSKMQGDYALDTYTMGDTKGNRIKVPHHRERTPRATPQTSWGSVGRRGSVGAWHDLPTPCALAIRLFYRD
ncbi:hypothetical protein BJ508DRAFT_335245 [Ascobolus immersus RN42]|uniref:CCHC-type domain-containing protein n=1 Tax=Ascobolus immersus RN42 TaxID=1160509 RepID=A0A3N4HD65_ASCIM|nr:hypothetical protein BJ508DRAFT_335245 [Ascobolus immersus RN42]